jgi:hypothetical protein
MSDKNFASRFRIRNKTLLCEFPATYWLLSPRDQRGSKSEVLLQNFGVICSSILFRIFFSHFHIDTHFYDFSAVGLCFVLFNA